MTLPSKSMPCSQCQNRRCQLIRDCIASKILSEILHRLRRVKEKPWNIMQMPDCEHSSALRAPQPRRYWPYAAAPDLPADHRYYVAGAVAFKHAAYADAQAYFAKSLALGSFERPFRAMALFMLGQTATKAAQPVQAARYFQALRAAVEPNNSTLGSKSGGVQVDPLGLALSSLGAEAKLHLQALKDNSYPGAKIAVPRMIKLYLAQAAQERLQSNSLIQLPGSGFVSLRLALRYLRTHPEQLEAGLADRLTARYQLSSLAAILEIASGKA